MCIYVCWAVGFVWLLRFFWSLEAGATAAHAVGGVGPAVDGHVLHDRVGLGHVDELVHDFAAAHLLGDVLGDTVILGHAGVPHTLHPLSDRVAGGAALKHGDHGEAELPPGVPLHNLVVVPPALAAVTVEGLRPHGKSGDSTGGLVGELGAPLCFPLELGPHMSGEGAATLRGQGNTVAGDLQLGLGEQTLAGAGDIGNLLVVVVTTEATELVFQQVGTLHLEPLAIKEDIDLGRLENHNIVLGHDDLGDNVTLLVLEDLPRNLGDFDGAAIDPDCDVVTLRLHGDLHTAKEDLDFLHGLGGVVARGLQGSNKYTIGHGLGTVTRDEVEAVIHVSLGGAVVKGGNVLTLQGAHWVERLASNSLDTHGNGFSDIGGRVHVSEGVGHRNIPVLVLLLRARDIGDGHIKCPTARVDGGPDLHLPTVGAIASTIASTKASATALQFHVIIHVQA